MSSTLAEEMELIEKHEQILGRRAELLEQMEGGREQLSVQKKQQLMACEDSRHRNSALLQDLQKIEDGLRGKELPCPYLMALETKYWASVEESIPAWEQFLLGKGPHPSDGPQQPPRRAKQKANTAKEKKGLPPHPKARTVR